eukprot:s1971_g12.t1
MACMLKEIERQHRDSDCWLYLRAGYCILFWSLEMRYRCCSVGLSSVRLTRSRRMKLPVWTLLIRCSLARVIAETRTKPEASLREFRDPNGRLFRLNLKTGATEWEDEKSQRPSEPGHAAELGDWLGGSDPAAEEVRQDLALDLGMRAAPSGLRGESRSSQASAALKSLKAKVETMSSEQKMLESQVFAVFLCSRAVFLAMSPSGGGGGPGAALSALSIGGGSEAVVRGELIEAPDGGFRFAALRRLRWGTPILTERPLLLLEPDLDRYLRAEDADPRFAELAEALGDSSRLAAYVAFRQLHERKQKEFLGLWREDLEASDPVAKAIHEANRNGIEAFLEDHPQFRQSIYWNHVILVSSIFGRFGQVNSDGSKAIYSICSHIRHSCKPNAAWFTLRKGFPRGKRMLHVISLDGIQRREEITVSHVEEPVLLQPRLRRSDLLLKVLGTRCPCDRCRANDEEADERIRYLFAKLSATLAVQPPTDSSTATAQECLRELDQLLPFSMQTKAKAKVLLATALGELSQRAAWQQDNRPANIVLWTGLDPESQEQRLKGSKRLYETAGKDFEYLLGQDALPILERMESGYAPVQDQHKMLTKYRDKAEAEVLESEGAGCAGIPFEHKPQSYEPNLPRPGMPPTWEELFKRTK